MPRVPIATSPIHATPQLVPACLLCGILLTIGSAIASSASAAAQGGQASRRSGVPVQVWLTTADGTRQLARQTDVAFGPVPEAPGPTITIDTTRVYQEMVGFGAALTESSAWLIENRMSPTQRTALLRDLFSPTEGIGLSFTRLAMGASDFALGRWSYDDVPEGQTDPALTHFSIDRDRRAVLPVLKEALAINPRLTVMASPWSAPAWMKTTGSMIKGTLRPDAYQAFAEYFKRFIEAYAAEGVPIYAITVQNEPHFEPDDYPGMRFTPSQRAEFLKQNVGPLFARAGIRTRILDWDHNWDEFDSPIAVLNDSAAKSYLGGVAWHCYAGDVGAQSILKQVHPDVDQYFTECSGGTWSPDYAQNLRWFAGTLMIGTTRHWAKGVLLWNLALDEKHGPHTGGCATCRGVVTIDSATGAVTRNIEYYVLGHVSKFVRPEAHRVASSSDLSLGIETVAFRNIDGSMALLVMNGAANTQNVRVQTGDEAFSYALPAGAVATFYWRP